MPDRVDVEVAADAEDARVDQPIEHHRRDVDRLLVGDAPSLHHARRHAERLGQLGSCGPPPCTITHAHAEVVQDGDLLDQDARVEAMSANTPPPAFTTKVLPLYMRM